MKKLLLTITILFTIFLFSCPVPKASGPNPFIDTVWENSDDNYEYSLSIYTVQSHPGKVFAKFQAQLKSSTSDLLAAIGPVTINGSTLTLKNSISSSGGFETNILLTFTVNSNFQSGIINLKLERQVPHSFTPLPQTITFQRKVS